MIRPPGFRGAAFGTAADGDAAAGNDAVAAMAGELGIAPDWARVRQVHGNAVLRAAAPGPVGTADALFTTTADLPIAVLTADCVPIVLEGEDVVAVVHAGWRGVVAGVVEATLHRLALEGLTARRAAVGPAIGPCCYAVGPEVRDRFPGFGAITRDGAPAVDLRAAAVDRLHAGTVAFGPHAIMEVWVDPRCTACEDGFFSYRRDGTPARQAAVAWIPS